MSAPYQHVIGTIREFNTARFRVIVDAIEDDDLDLSWDDDGSTRAGLESGKYIAFCARARCLLDGLEVASEYLGGCIYERIEAFEDHRECGAATRRLREQGNPAVVGSYFADMVSEVIYHARAEVARLQSVRVRKP